MDNVEQVIANIRARNVDLSTEGDKIVASRPLLPDERKVFEEHRAEAIALINGTPTTETATQAYQRGLRDGYAAGLRDTLEELNRRPVESRPGPPPRVTTPNEEIKALETWLANKGSYYSPWEPEVLEALRATLVPGEKIQPMYAYSLIIIGVDGKEREFKRVPTKEKK
jgi:hypothetical protein